MQHLLHATTVVSNEAGISQSGGNTTEGGVVSTLTLLSVDVDDNGPYTCVMLGTELKGTVSLLILGKHNNKNNKALVLIACNTVYTGVNGACNMFPISCNVLHAPLTPV